MKRFICGICAIVLSLICFSGVFGLSTKKQTNAALSSLYFDESEIRNKRDIISATDSKYFSNVDVSQNGTPYDSNQKKQLDGIIYTPRANEYNEVNISFSVSAFNMTFSDSLFMWIYIPDENIYNLSVSLMTSSGKVVEWKLSASDLRVMLNDSYTDYIFGWKLFEFCLSDATYYVNSEVFESKDIVILNLAYTGNSEALLKYSNNTLSVFHAYLGTKKSVNSTVVKTTNFVNYKFNSDLKNNTFFVGDELKFTSEQDIFSELLIGKYDLKKVTNTNFSFEVKISEESISSETTYNFGRPYGISNKGNLTINICITEKLTNFSRYVFNKNLQFYVDEFVLGSFNIASATIDKGESKVFAFYFSSSFDYEKNFLVSVSDKSIATVTNYYVKDGVGYAVVEGTKKGKIQLTAEAYGKRKNGDYQTQKYTTSSVIKVVSNETSSVQKIIMWVIFGIYLGSLLIFILISFVNARRFGVK